MLAGGHIIPPPPAGLSGTSPVAHDTCGRRQEEHAQVQGNTANQDAVMSSGTGTSCEGGRVARRQLDRLNLPTASEGAPTTKRSGLELPWRRWSRGTFRPRRVSLFFAPRRLIRPLVLQPPRFPATAACTGVTRGGAIEDAS